MLRGFLQCYDLRGFLQCFNEISTMSTDKVFDNVIRIFTMLQGFSLQCYKDFGNVSMISTMLQGFLRCYKDFYCTMLQGFLQSFIDFHDVTTIFSMLQ